MWSKIRRGVHWLFWKLWVLAEWLNLWASGGQREFYEADEFPWARDVEAGWMDVRAELEALLPRISELPNLQDLDVGLKVLSTDSKWKIFMMYGYGQKIPQALKQCPKTAQLLERIPGVSSALFSILRGPKNIPPHRGPYNGVLRYHLPLIVPRPVDGAENNDCYIKVGRSSKAWEEGKSMIFDDTNQHQVFNARPGNRVVLFVDFYRPVRWRFVHYMNLFLMWMTRYLPFYKVALDNFTKWQIAWDQHDPAKQN